MKKYIISAAVVLVSVVLVWSAFGQPAGGNTAGENRRGGMGMDRAGGMRGGMMGRARQRPAREERLAAIKTLEKEIATLKAAIEKAPATDPNIATLEGDALAKFMAQYTEENTAVSAIQQTLASISGRGGRGGFGGASADVLSELRVLAQQEKASKTVARLDALIKEEQTRAARRGTRGAGGQGQEQGGQRRNQQQ
jgi:hypothetical protein